MPEFPTAAFADVLAANDEFAEHFSGQHLTGQAMRGLAIITRMFNGGCTARCCHCGSDSKNWQKQAPRKRSRSAHF